MAGFLAGQAKTVHPTYIEKHRKKYGEPEAVFQCR